MSIVIEKRPGDESAWKAGFVKVNFTLPILERGKEVGLYIGDVPAAMEGRLQREMCHASKSIEMARFV